MTLLKIAAWHPEVPQELAGWCLQTWVQKVTIDITRLQVLDYPLLFKQEISGRSVAVCIRLFSRPK